MTHARRWLCLAYAAAALAALGGTWYQNVAYLRPDENWLTGFALATARFWRDTFANPASTSITIDIGWLTMSVCVLMVIESRRLAIPFVWLYILGGLLVAISFTFPLFLIARERRLAARGEADVPLGLSHADGVGFIGLAAIVGFMTIRSLVR